MVEVRDRVISNNSFMRQGALSFVLEALQKQN